MTDIRTNIDQYVPDDDARADADAAEGLSVARMTTDLAGTMLIEMFPCNPLWNAGI